MKHIARSTLIIAIFFGLEKVLGFIRHVIIARSFRLSAELDAFNAANNIPDLVFALISGGALAMAFIPVLSETREEKGKEQTWLLFSRITNLIFLAAIGLSLLIALGANQLVSWEIGIAPGFGVEQQQLVVRLMRLNLIATVLFALGGLAIAGLQAHQHFLLPALAPSMYDLGSLAGILILAPEKGFQLGPITLPAFGLGVDGLVYGVIFGAALFLLVQIPGLLRFQFRWTPSLSVGDSSVLEVLRLMGPRVLTVLFIHLIFLTQDNLASRLSVGAVTALVYGWLFMQVPQSVIGTALGTALLPTLAEQTARGEREKFHGTLEVSIQTIIALSVPAGVILAINLPPLIEILNFDSAGSDLVVWTARAYLTGLLGHSLLEISARSFYARHNAIVPLITSGISLIGFLLSGILLTGWLGAPGIGLANSLVFTLEAVLLFYLLYRPLPYRPRLKSTVLRTAAASAVGAGISVLLLSLVDLSGQSSLLSAAAAGGASLIAAAGAAPFVIPEIKALLRV